MNPITIRIGLSIALLAASGAVMPLPVQPRIVDPFGDHPTAVADATLERVRGGFGGSDGLDVSFGIDRAVYVNGTLVTQTSMNLTVAGTAASMVTQTGAGNAVSNGALSANTVGTVVQNTLDGQKIQNVTTINASVNSLGLLRNLNLGSSLRAAVIDSLRR